MRLVIALAAFLSVAACAHRDQSGSLYKVVQYQYGEKR